MTNVFIYGGCTSRDAVDLYPEFGLNLHSYIARQSLISAFHPARTALWDLPAINSTFQRRMIRWDIAGYLPQHLVEHHAEIDLVIWDLMIERVGVRAIRGGGYVTNNPQTRKFATAGRLGPNIAFGTEQHFELWDETLTEFVQLLNATGLIDKVCVNATPWAYRDSGGNLTDYPTAGMTATFFNETIQRYWQKISDSGIRVLRIAQSDAIADPQHKWGPAYFHYVPQTYEAQLRALSS